MKINDFLKMKKDGKIIKMITCYDYWTANIISTTNIDCVLIGDSSAMVMHGHDSTVTADLPMLISHLKAVRSGIGNKFIIADLPFMSYRKSQTEAICAVEQLVKAGANAVKLENVTGHEHIISHIIHSGVPVMGHLGYTPQSTNSFSNHVQGKDDKQIAALLSDAKKLEELGCFAIVLECVTASVAELITSNINIPTIGIGSGNKTSGQVLVLQDLLGANPNFNPKFLKKYLDIFSLIKNAVNDYCLEVDNNLFPSKHHIYEHNNASN